MFKRSLLLVCPLVAACGLFTSTSEPVVVAPGEVEVFLADKLDGNLSNYCIDIAGGRENVDTSKGLQGHTCYSYTGTLGTDQIFDSAQFSSNTLRLPRYDVCATLGGMTAGSKVGLAPCDGSPAQGLSFSGDGTIQSVATPTMCLTVADSTKSGKSSKHQIRALTLELCSEEAKARQVWKTRTKAD